MKDGRFLVTEQCSPHKREFFDKYLSPPKKKVYFFIFIFFFQREVCSKRRLALLPPLGGMALLRSVHPGRGVLRVRLRSHGKSFLHSNSPPTYIYLLNNLFIEYKYCPRWETRWPTSGWRPWSPPSSPPSSYYTRYTWAEKKHHVSPSKIHINEY